MYALRAAHLAGKICNLLRVTMLLESSGLSRLLRNGVHVQLDYPSRTPCVYESLRSADRKCQILVWSYLAASSSLSRSLHSSIGSVRV